MKYTTHSVLAQCSVSTASVPRQYRVSTASVSLYPYSRSSRPRSPRRRLSPPQERQAGDLGVFAVFDGHGGADVSAALEAVFADCLAARLDALPDGEDLGRTLTETVEALDEAFAAGPLGLGGLLGRSFLHPFSRQGSTACVALADAASGRIVAA